MNNKKLKHYHIFLILIIAGSISSYFFYKSNIIFKYEKQQPANNNPNHYLSKIFKNQNFNNDYYYNQIKELDERIKIEQSQESEQEEIAKRNGTESPYKTNFYSTKKEILDVKGIFKKSLINYSEALVSVILLNYYGVNITEEKFINQYFDSNRIIDIASTSHSVNPTNNCVKVSEEYYSNCFAASLRDILQEAFGYEKTLISYEGMNLNYMIPHFPVIVWIGKDYQEAKEIVTWKSVQDEAIYTYPKDSTAIIIVGYDLDNFYIIDPTKSSEITKINRLRLSKSYDSYGRQGLGVYNGQTGLFK